MNSDVHKVKLEWLRWKFRRMVQCLNWLSRNVVAPLLAVVFKTCLDKSKADLNGC